MEEEDVRRCVVLKLRRHRSRKRIGGRGGMGWMVSIAGRMVLQLVDKIFQRSGQTLQPRRPQESLLPELRLVAAFLRTRVAQLYTRTRRGRLIPIDGKMG